MVSRQARALADGVDTNRSRRSLGVDVAQTALIFAVLAPGIAFALLGLLWLAGWIPRERLVSRITGSVFLACLLALSVIVWRLAGAGSRPVVVTFGDWFAVHEYHFPLILKADRLSLPF